MWTIKTERGQATERATVSLTELQSSVAETGVKVKVSNRALHVTDLKRPEKKKRTSTNLKVTQFQSASKTSIKDTKFYVPFKKIKTIYCKTVIL